LYYGWDRRVRKCVAARKGRIALARPTGHDSTPRASGPRRWRGCVSSRVAALEAADERADRIIFGREGAGAFELAERALGQVREQIGPSERDAECGGVRAPVHREAGVFHGAPRLRA